MIISLMTKNSQAADVKALIIVRNPYKIYNVFKISNPIKTIITTAISAR